MERNKKQTEQEMAEIKEQVNETITQNASINAAKKKLEADIQLVRVINYAIHSVFYNRKLFSLFQLILSSEASFLVVIFKTATNFFKFYFKMLILLLIKLKQFFLGGSRRSIERA